MDSHPIPRKLWEHPDPQSTEMYKFMQEVNKKRGLRLKTFPELYNFSVTERSNFWDLAFNFLNIIHSGSYKKVVDESALIDSVPYWFEGVNVNIAENLLYTRSRSDPSNKHGTKGKEDKKIAVTEVREGATEIRHISWGQLRSEVGELTSAMKAHGVKKGDRIAIVASNSLDTLKVFLASTALGGLFSSSSTDMGTKGVLDRLLQIEPKFLFMDDWAVYNGKTVDLRQKMTDIVNGMKSVKDFKSLVSMPRFTELADIRKVPRSQTFKSFLSRATSNIPQFETTAFRDPFMIAYSSGTTGMPKCIVHSIGGALLSSAKEIILHREIGPDSVSLQYTTTGWIMYFSSVMNLLPGARVILYDGSPFQPDMSTFIKLIGDQKVTKLGTSPKWMSELQKNDIAPRDVTDLSSLRMVTSTGMVLTEQQFEWFYDVAFPKEVHLANIAGGTDIAGCFCLENPLTPVYLGGTQGPSLGTPIAVYDSLTPPNLPGIPVPSGEPGELVATAAFPNLPTHFHGDLPPSNPTSKYHQAYFTAHPHVWTHGDFISQHPATHQILFHGRSDGVLNPSGIRFGSAEIYGLLEVFFVGRVADAICVGQRRPSDDDEAVMLFLQMAPGVRFTEELVREVKGVVRRELSARHVPKWVFETREIPTTVNGKKVELPVKQIVSGKTVKASGTLANPASLDYYYQFANVEELVKQTGTMKSKL